MGPGGQFVGTVKLGNTIAFPLLVMKTGSWLPTGASGTPSYSVYGNDFSAALLSGKSALKGGAFAAVTGAYYISQGFTAASGFEAGYTYSVLSTYRLNGGNVLQRQWHTVKVT